MTTTTMREPRPHPGAERFDPLRKRVGRTDTDGGNRPSRVAWTRGPANQRLAELLAADAVVAPRDDLLTLCIDERIDLLVTRRFTSFDLVPTLVPMNVDLGAVRSVTAAVGDGPNSELVATVAGRLADRLGVPGELVTVYREPVELPAAMRRMARLAAREPDLGRRIAQGASAASIIDTLDASTLLVVGAPDGSWVQRRFLGSGRLAAAAAPGGILLARSAPRSASAPMAADAAAELGALLDRGPVPVVDRRDQTIGVGPSPGAGVSP